MDRLGAYVALIFDGGLLGEYVVALFFFGGGGAATFLPLGTCLSDLSTLP